MTKNTYWKLFKRHFSPIANSFPSFIQPIFIRYNRLGRLGNPERIFLRLIDERWIPGQFHSVVQSANRLSEAKRAVLITCLRRFTCFVAENRLPSPLVFEESLRKIDNARLIPREGIIYRLTRERERLVETGARKVGKFFEANGTKRERWKRA